MASVPSRWCLSALLLALSLAPAAAHHSPASFDLSRDVMLEGTVADVSWRNPHVYFKLEVVGAGGQKTLHEVEAGPASNLAALGFNANSLVDGERVALQAKPNRRGAGEVLGWVLTKADGTVIPLHVRAAPATQPGTAEASGLAGTWVPQGTAFTSLAVAARAWPLTDAGRTAAEGTSVARARSRSACVPFGPPALMSLPSAVQIEVSDATVIFRLDTFGTDVRRVVHLDRAAHPANLEPSLHGHSIGRWEGGALVVDTVGYAAHPDGLAFDLPSSASKHVVERFALAADRKHIDYEVVVEDPEYLAAAITHRGQWDYRPEQRPSNLPCDGAAAARFTEDE
jgi:hypothetical protein